MLFVFCNFLGINPFGKIYPNYEEEWLVAGKILSSLKWKKCLNPKLYITFGVWGLKTNYGQFEPKRLINP